MEKIEIEEKIVAMLKTVYDLPIVRLLILLWRIFAKKWSQ